MKNMNKGPLLIKFSLQYSGWILNDDVFLYNRSKILFKLCGTSIDLCLVQDIT